MHSGLLVVVGVIQKRSKHYLYKFKTNRALPFNGTSVVLHTYSPGKLILSIMTSLKSIQQGGFKLGNNVVNLPKIWIIFDQNI